MVPTCKGTCIEFRVTGYEGKHRYKNGQKLCPVCSIFLTWDGVRCPCCTVKLRTTPRGNKAGKEIHEKRNCVWQ